MGTRTTGASLTLVQAALRRGLNVTVISAPHDIVDGAFAPQVQVAYLEPHPSAVTSWLQTQHPDEYAARSLRVTTTNDNYARLAAQVADHAGLPGPCPSDVARCVSKARQKALLLKHGLPSARFVTGSLTDLPTLLRRVEALNFPVVAKPAEASASDGVKLCFDRRELQQHMTELQHRSSPAVPNPVCEEVVVEEYVPGEEYCVECFDGRYVGAIRKLKQPGYSFQERGYTSELGLDERALRRMKDVCTHAVEIAGLAWGPVHIDCIVTSGHASIVELNPRIAGSFICEVVRDSYGFDAVGSLLDKLDGCFTPPADLLFPTRYARVELLLDSEGGTREFADAATLSSQSMSISYGIQRLRNNRLRSFVYVRANTAEPPC